MRKNRTLLLVSSIMVVSGCSTLDSSSTFEDVASSVKERHNYIQVIAKEITPDADAKVGSDVVKSSLYYVGNYPKSNETQVHSSYIDMNVTSFKSYDNFSNVMINDKKIAIKEYRPQAETCTEHCTVTQWFQFPLSNETVSSIGSDVLTFTLSSKTDRNVVEFSLPKAYFDAVKKEAEFVMGKQPQISSPAPTQTETLPMKLNGSKSQDMVQYWFGEATEAEQKQFADWAFSQRSSVTDMIKTESKPVEMMAYWYDKADKTEKSNILSWLLRQE